MSLSWKDFITTLLAAITFGLYWAMTKGISIPLITGYKAAIILLAAIGLFMCAFAGNGGNSWTNTPNLLIIIASLLGVGALILIIYGLITGAEIAFSLLAATIIVLWVISTFRHLITK